MKLKKRILILGLSIVISFLNVDFATAQKKVVWPSFLKIATPRVGTANHSIASAWSAAFTADTGVRARVLPCPTSYGRAEWLTTKQVDISLYQASEYIEQLDAVEGYASKAAGPADSQVAYISLITPWGFMVRGDSKIKTIYDINKDTKVAWYMGASFLMTGVKALLAMQGLTTDDVKLVLVGNYGANSKVIPEGRADVTFTSPISDLNYEVAANPRGIRWLEIPSKEEDAEVYQTYKALQAGYAIVPVKSGHSSAHGIRMAQAYQVYHVRGDEDPEFVYQLVKWFDQNLDKFKDKYTHAKLMNLDNFIEFLENDPVEVIHPGMIRYLEEKGLWKKEYEKTNEFNSKLSQKYIRVFNEAVSAAEAKNIKIDPQEKEWVTFLKQYQKDNGITQSYGSVKRP